MKKNMNRNGMIILIVIFGLGEFDGEKVRIVSYSYADFLGDMKVEPTRIGVKEGAK